MDSYYGESRELPTAESQPTQLLRNVLRGDMEPPPIPDDREDANGDANVTKDSFDSSSSSMRHPTTRYHFHGLASTQTQTQHEACVENEGSQKENTPTSGELKAATGLNSQPCSPRAITAKIPSKMPNSDITGQPLGYKGTVAMTTNPPLFVSSEHASASRNKTAKAVSFQSRTTGAPASPAKGVRQSRTMQPRSSHYYRRSPSQDSFAGPLSQDPEKQFFASTRQFDVPLSELGLPSTQETHSSEAQPVETGPSFMEAMASAYAEEKRNRAAEFHNSAHHGRVLVAATPSHSGSSQGEPISQQSDDDQQFYGHQPDPTYDDIPDNHDNSQQSTQLFEDSSEPSSSYERLLAGEVPTQAVELQATQIDGSGADLGVQADEVDTNNEPKTQLQTASGVSSVPSTVPRSIGFMVDPNKPWRLQKYGISAPQHPRPQPTFQTPTRGEVIPETQPSDITANNPAVPEGQRGPSRDFGHMHRNNIPAHPLSSPSHPDAMDIVPDSEPPRAAPSQLTPLRPTGSEAHGLLTSRRDGIGMPHSGDLALLPAVIEHTAADHGDDEDEDDIPLAATRALKIVPASKGKGRAETTYRAADANTMTKDSRQTRAGPSVPPPQGRSWQTGVPSSAPGQDVDATSNAQRPSRANKVSGGKPPSVTSSRKTRSASASSSVPAKKRRISSDTEDDDELRLTADDSVFIPKAEKEEEEETEPADDGDGDNDMDVDVQGNDPEPGPSTHKRKRAATSKGGSKKMSRASAKPNIARSTPGFSSRPNKRLRSVVSSSRPISEPATRVFALWKQDSYYYSGIVHSHSTSTKYLVKFDDGTEDNVDVSKMRRCELVVDDEVILVEDDRRAKIKEVQNNHPDVAVEVDDGDEVELFDVAVQDLRIAGRTILKHWQDRTLTVDMINPVLKPKPLKSTPSPSKASMLSAASTKGGRGKTLNRIGLVITLSPGNDNREKHRDNVISAIKNNGGTVIEDWSQIFPMEGTHSHMNKRWVACAEDVKWVAKDGIQRVFLLADDANTKPKFLIALALGIPCLSFEWLHATVDKGTKDWQPYLLPAGFCEALHARVSQMVDLDWGNSTEQLSDIMCNQVASKLFNHNSVLCLGADFVPLLKVKRTTSDPEKAKEASRTVPRIILSMGAKRVEAASEIKYASDQSLKSFDYVVVKDADEVVHGLSDGNVTFVHVPWVKDCLIAGRLLEAPKW
ncbi:hypothetical protein PILCRDRAFT_815647 [Piloderma croceum F 1598]|uniref:BRCT domain-containing protein n=1 Tax=Piloderma croceum (strain F 1598) TaxID=765440 RepID=A0A0C3CBX9_PILCF|nr:hypothetical protein PILCRDRAFT_815647 [Piloderma croceum F 1598]